MKSLGARTLAQQKGQMLQSHAAKQQAAWRSRNNINKGSLVEYIDMDALQQKTTDYRGEPKLENIPLKARAKAQRSKWPNSNRMTQPKLMPPSRNTRTIWRRYPNGQIDVGWAYGKISEAINKVALNIALNENDALAVTSVFTEVRFTNLPTSIVNIKATLTQKERETLRSMVSKRELEDLFGKNNNNS